MTQYTVANEWGRQELLEVAAETDLGFHVRISVTDLEREYQDFIARNLFETLIKSGVLEPLISEAQAV